MMVMMMLLVKTGNHSVSNEEICNPVHDKRAYQ